MKPACDKVDIFMPIYIGDYLKDTVFLSTEEHGAYLLMLFACWQHGSIPNNDRVIRRITGLEADAWEKSKPILLRFFKIKGDHLYHSRVERELVSAKEKKASFSERGKKGNEARWGSLNNPSRSPLANPLAKKEGIPKSSPSPSPSPTSLSPESTSSSPTPSLSPEVQSVLSCRPEFLKLNPDAVAREIQVGRERGDSFKRNFDSFLADAANSIPCPKNPIGMLRAYLNKLDSGKKQPSGRRSTI